MNAESRWARRYHWLGEHVDDFVCEPHDAIRDLAGVAAVNAPCGRKQLTLLNMVAQEADRNRDASAALVRENPDWVLEQINRCTEGPTLFAPAHHRVLKSDVNTKRLRKIIITAHEEHPDDFGSLLGTGGVGPATIRSLALLAEVIFDAPVSHRDPAAPVVKTSTRQDRRWADYSYAHGGKDGTPFPVDRATYDRNIAVLTDAVRQARLGENEKFYALRRLAKHDR